ncbi:two-component system cell cycle sensor histidine kinase/response regulator CckA [Hasllibacter halocynthiae]|uniref:histidine kinase n=1 Tax=Hasllibacter halocynthiae TaxID=595589 RepID=A0A2T0X8S0_9RHOB|nr:ATP-binding protein [Hasllibacter halocynthiae]PRY95264.1 two-component system cell cycle sensor histidine kinase/response regulator CckA [Hasllibacter halocynthiae]
MSMTDGSGIAGGAPRRAAGLLIAAAGMAAFLVLPEGMLRLALLGLSAGLGALALGGGSAVPKRRRAPGPTRDPAMDATAPDADPGLVAGPLAPTGSVRHHASGGAARDGRDFMPARAAANSPSQDSARPAVPHEFGGGLEDAFAAMPVALVAIREGGFVYAGNPRAQALLAHDLRTAPHLRDLVGGLGRSIRDWVEDALEGRGLGHPEVLRARLPQAETYIQVTFGRVLRDGAPTLIAHLSDATEFKTLEAQFVQGQKMQAIGQLAGGVAHDFNNLLTAISGHCDLLMLRRDQHDPDYADLVQINQNANRAAGLVGQLLAFSRKQNLQPEVLDVAETLSELTHLLNRLVGERVALTLNPSAEVGRIRADRRQMEQVLMNLVVNARDALPEGGAIRIEGGDLDLVAPLLRDRAEVPAGTYVELRVTDEGCGIPPDQLGKIFEPFWTTKRPGEGTGLGLSTVYGIVKQTGGFIFVDSEVGVGTTFQLLFPRHEPAAPSEEPEVAPAAEPRGDGMILLVEDEAPVRNFASRALQLQGYEVVEAESAEAALELLEDPRLKVDLFVTDVVMPGLDGPSWVQRARQERPDVRVVFMSGYAEEALDGSAGAIPHSVFLPKPFSLEALSRTVARQLEGHGASARAAPRRRASSSPEGGAAGDDLLTAASRAGRPDPGGRPGGAAAP